MWDEARDARLRREAMAWLAIRTDDGREPIASTDLLDFTFDGEPFRLMDVQRGIRKPAVLDAALSIRTVYTAEGKERPYDDRPGPDGMLRYKWRGDDPDHPENRALRAAWRRDDPLIWFFGVGEALHLPVFPVYVLAEEHAHQQFVVDPNVGHGLLAAGSIIDEQMCRYVVTQTRRRLHQPVFRAQVMRAYETRCCVCALRHRELLDAAHIAPDSSEHGIAAVRNGLALCKIHHAAFDANILGISPDLVVAIRDDLLHEIDGPMLRHGLQERHGERLRVVPTRRAERPDRELLEGRFAQFRAAG
jgi:putative restriction endonuclease